MSKNKDVKSAKSNGFNLDAELSAIKKKNVLPPRIIDKIGGMLKEKNIAITKEQLYLLLDKIQSVLQAYAPSGQSFTPLSSSNSSDGSDDMKTLFESIERIEERIERIEEEKLAFMKENADGIVKVDDVKTLDSVDNGLHHGIEPLCEIGNDPESVVVLMKWLQYLVDKIGKSNLGDILGYYVDVEWISDDVRLDLLKYSKGISDAKEAVKKGMNNLSTKDHIQSLLFIQKLKGHQLDEHFVWKIDREMEKMSKSIDENNYK